MVVEGSNLDHAGIRRIAEIWQGHPADRHTQLDGPGKGVVGRCEVLAVTADRRQAAQDELLDGEERIIAQLQAGAHQQLT
jgi:hypothetical protein